MSESTSTPEEVQENSAEDKLLEKSMLARQKYWKRYGKVHSGVLTNLNNPMFMGGPKWPAMRPSFVRIERSNSVVIASDGLSDPWPGEEERGQGFGLEFYMETRDKEIRAKNWEEMKASWMFQTLYNVAQTAAHQKNFRQLIDDEGIFSMELELVNAPEHMQNEKGNIGVLVGVDPKSITPELQLPLQKIKLVAVVLLTPEELAYVMREGEAGQKKMNKLLRKRGQQHLSSVDRKSLIK